MTGTAGSSSAVGPAARETWVECLAQGEGLFTLTEHRFSDAGINESVTTSLAFRSETRLRETVTTAGFTVERVLATGTGGPWAAGRVN